VIEAYGNIWDHIDDYDAVIITTNGFVKKNGEAVMGRGIALEAKERWPWLPQSLGIWLQTAGNIPGIFTTLDEPEIQDFPYILTMPVKPRIGPKGEPGWKAKADLVLIGHSLRYLQIIAEDYEFKKIIMPRPGCGNGGLKWEDVKPVIKPYLDDRFTVMERI